MPLRLPLVLLVFGLASAPAAFAQQIPVGTWSAPGLTGIVDEADLSIHRFNDTGSVSIPAGVARATLNLRYPIGAFTFVPQEGDCTELRANLRDTGAGARVIVRLMRLAIGGEAGVGGLKVLAGIDSDQFPGAASDQYRTYGSCLATDVGHLHEYTYFVDVQLIKTASTANPGLLSLQICPSQDACDP